MWTDALVYGQSLQGEYDAALGDGRLTRRLQSIGEKLRAKPTESFPDVFDDDATELEGFYRFVGNERLSFNAVLSGHHDATVERARLCGEVTVIHDTTEFSFAQHDECVRSGLIPLSKARQGFLGHASLVASADGLRAPLGVLHMRPFIHRDHARDDATRSFWQQSGHWTVESERWIQGVRNSARSLADVPHIHVMDREGDIYQLIHALVTERHRFIIRAAQDRKLANQPSELDMLFSALEQTPWSVHREVRLSARNHSGTPPRSRNNPARRSRAVTLSFRARTIELKRPVGLPAHIGVLPTLQVNLVEAVERNPPGGEPPVRWLLLTTEPIDSAQDVLRIVDLYRSRWLVEELFKAIKTGCAYDKRQLASAHSLLLALALTLPVAWHLLLMRYLSRHSPDAPATTVLSEVQLRVLRGGLKKTRLSQQPTVREVLLAVARLGGHLPRNGPPGWQTLGRGYRKLLDYERGWRIAHGENLQGFSDQA